MAATRAEGEPPPFTHEDNRRFLQMLRDKKQMLGVASLKAVEVQFQDLTVEIHERIGRREPPTLPNCVVNAAQELASYSHMCTTRKRAIKIINGASGTIRPSR
ncbi:unnamed protein product [Triticum turgidum subsp. durum]|nr:unnamed protein product [Triticum turgidum subsp. durum]